MAIESFDNFYKSLNLGKIGADICKVIELMSDGTVNFADQPRKSNISINDNLIFSDITGYPLGSVYNYLDSAVVINDNSCIVFVIHDNGVPYNLRDGYNYDSYMMYNKVKEKYQKYSVVVINQKDNHDKEMVSKFVEKALVYIVDHYLQEITDNRYLNLVNSRASAHKYTVLRDQIEVAIARVKIVDNVIDLRYGDFDGIGLKLGLRYDDPSQVMMVNKKIFNYAIEKNHTDADHDELIIECLRLLKEEKKTEG